MAEKRLEGKTIVISGGTSGVGKTAAEEFAAQGARIVIGGRNEEAALRSLRVIRTYCSQGIFVHTELEDVDDCKKLFDEATAEFGKIDGFFNYAGVTPVSPLDTCDQATFDKVMNVNFRAAFFCCQNAVNHMRKAAGGRLSSPVPPMRGAGKKTARHTPAQKVFFSRSWSILPKTTVKTRSAAIT